MAFDPIIQLNWGDLDHLFVKRNEFYRSFFIVNASCFDVYDLFTSNYKKN